jgi:hypothetical protein
LNVADAFDVFEAGIQQLQVKLMQFKIF